MKIVSDASPLINLARIGELGLLRKLYEELIIPEAVWNEVVVDGAGQAGAAEVNAAKWIKTKKASNKNLVQALQQNLDAGESEAIALALEINTVLLLMDERIGREVARHLGLHCTGLIGVLIEAKHKEHIISIKPHLDSLRQIAGFRINDDLYLRVLQDEDEA